MFFKISLDHILVQKQVGDFLKSRNQYYYFIPTVIVIFSLILAIYYSKPSLNLVDNKEMSSSECSSQNFEHKENFNGLWVSYITLDMRNTDMTEQTFKEKFNTIIDNAKQNKINNLIVQVRAFSDAYYKSSVYPTSHLLTGTQGTQLSYDPLEYMVKSAHKNNIKIHAWVNPYRITLNSNPGKLSDNSFFKPWIDENNECIMDYKGNKYLNPACKQVQEKIIAGIEEIVKNYDIDGIQFDDYFYPSDDKELDAKSYQNYLNANPENHLDLMSWRKQNVNDLISNVYKAIKTIRPSVIFGISPQANLNNDEKLCADVNTWCSQSGYIDYICPQIYVNFENKVLPFNLAADQWKALVSNSNVKLYFGLAAYKASDANYDSSTWLNSNDILKREIEYSKNIGVNDFIFYDYENLISDKAREEIKNAVAIIS